MWYFRQSWYNQLIIRWFMALLYSHFDIDDIDTVTQWHSGLQLFFSPEFGFHLCWCTLLNHATQEFIIKWRGWGFRFSQILRTYGKTGWASSATEITCCVIFWLVFYGDDTDALSVFLLSLIWFAKYLFALSVVALAEIILERSRVIWFVWSKEY